MNIGTARKGKKYPPERLSQAEVQAIYDTCSQAPTSLRDNALLHVFGGSGLRHEEALDLMPSDVSLTERYIHIREGKGKKSGIVGIDKATLEALRAWKDYRSTLDLPRGAPFFCTIRGEIGKPLSQRNVRAMLASRVRRAGIDKRVTPHTLRHALAVSMAEDGEKGVAIQQTLRHGNLSTTAVYLQTLNPEEGLDAIRKR